MVFGASSGMPALSTRYLPLGYDDTTPLAAGQSAFQVPAPGVFSRLYYYCNLTNTGTDLVVYTLVINGVDSALTVSPQSGTTVTLADTTHSAAVVAGDVILMKAVRGVSVGTAGARIFVSVQFAPTG